MVAGGRGIEAVKDCAVPAPVVGGVYASLFDVGGGVYTSFDMLTQTKNMGRIFRLKFREDRRRTKTLSTSVFLVEE